MIKWLFIIWAYNKNRFQHWNYYVHVNLHVKDGDMGVSLNQQHSGKCGEVGDNEGGVEVWCMEQEKVGIHVQYLFKIWLRG